MNLKRLNTFIKEGRLIRANWTGTDKEGRETACLLTALYPEVKEGDYKKCPSNEMPEWFARLTPWIDDAGSVEKWPGVIRRYAKNIAVKLSPESWQRLEYKVKLACVVEAKKYTQDESAIAVCDDVIGLLQRAVSNDFPSKEEWKAAEAAAWAAEAAWAWAAVAAWAAWAAWAWAWAAVAEARAEAAAEAAWADNIIEEIFKAWEEEIENNKTVY